MKEGAQVTHPAIPFNGFRILHLNTNIVAGSKTDALIALLEEDVR
jgi:hypothetical protein